MPRAWDFRKLGRDALSGNWLTAILVIFLASLLGLVVYIVFSPSYLFGYVHLLPAFTSIYILSGIVVFAVNSALEIGVWRFFTNLNQRKEIGVANLFSGFRIFGKALLLKLYMSLLITLWSLLLIVPGIIAYYRYSMAPFLMSQNPELGVMEAVDLSKKMMQGHKGRLFCLQLSFIGWFILVSLLSSVMWFAPVSILFVGIGMLFVNCYFFSAVTAFYLDLQYHYWQETGGLSREQNYPINTNIDLNATTNP